MKPQNTYFVWAEFQRRAVSFAEVFDFSVRHISTDSQSKIGKLGRYVSSMIQTIQQILKESPQQVWLQLPPNFLVHIVLFLRWITRKKYKIIADCHNASLRPPWSSLPFAISAMNKCDLVIVHNSDVYNDALNLGLSKNRLIVLEDAPAYVLEPQHQDCDDEGHVLVPCSFHDDEPIEELLMAAKLCPDITFKITGPRQKAEAKGFISQAPDNVDFTGFVSVEEYDQLVWSAGIILGLTTMDGIQLSVAGEAIGAGRPLLLSDTSTLRGLFEDGAMFVANTAEGLADGIQKAFEQREDLARASLACGQARYLEWQDQAKAVKGRLL